MLPSTLLGASNPPAGGAATSDVIFATAGAVVVTILLLGPILLYKQGRFPLLGRLAAFDEKMTGLPGWASLPGSLLGVALLTAAHERLGADVDRVDAVPVQQRADPADAADVRVAVLAREAEPGAQVGAHDVAVEQLDRPAERGEPGDQELGDRALAGAGEAGQPHGGTELRVES